MPNIELKKIGDLIPYFNNPRNNKNAVDKVAESIKQFGFQNPIIVDRENVVIAGHTRLKAAEALGFDEVPVIVAKSLTDEQARAYRLADNKTGEFAEWDFEKLNAEIAELNEFDLSAFGFDIDELNNFDEPDDVEHSTLDEKFIFAPFSVLDGRAGKWQDRKKQWLNMGIESSDGRENDLIGGLAQCAQKYASANSGLSLTGTSVFDPVICELMYKWFNVYQGSVFDPFAGGSVRGIVAAMLGYDYTGIDLRQEQIDANYKNAEELNVAPKWFCDDSLNADKYVNDETIDMVFSCPPYADLEVYSDDPRDISNMNYDDFIKTYREIIRLSVKKLRQDRFAVFVVGDVRSKDGFYYDFISDTKKAFIDCGVKLYNEIIKLDALATAPVRAALQMKNRKVVKVHQNVLIFYKGDPKNIRLHYGEIEVGDVFDYQKEL